MNKPEFIDWLNSVKYDYKHIQLSDFQEDKLRFVYINDNNEIVTKDTFEYDIAKRLLSKFLV